MRFAWSYECPWEGRTGHWLPILALQFSGIWPWACNFSVPQFLHLLNGDSEIVSHSIIIKRVCAHAQLPCCIQLLAILCMVALQAPLSMGFSRQEYWSGLPFPFPGNLPNPGIEPAFLMSPALACEFFVTSATWEAAIYFSKSLPQSYKEHLVGYGNLLQGLFLTQGSNLHLLHCRQILYPLTYLGSPNSVVCDSLWPHGLQHSMLPCPLLSPGACSNSCPFSQWCRQTISSSVTPFSSCSQSWSASESLSMSQFFASGGQSIGASASASVLPMNIQGWFSLGLIGLTSLLLTECGSLEKGMTNCFSILASGTLWTVWKGKKWNIAQP